MKQRTRIYYTETQRALMWERWRAGDTLHAIAKLFDRNHTSVHHIFARTGGIRPPSRCRSTRALALAEREEISRGVMAGLSARSIARSLRRSPSTVSREIRRNGGRCSYRASAAERGAWDRALRPKRCKLARNRTLAHLVAGKLRLQWSPYQVAGWLKRTYPQDESRQVSHETIYRTLFIQARAVPGHWEGDLLFGSNNSQIATLVERHTRYVMLVRVARKDSETVINALIKQAHKLPRELYKSLTWDRGSEMAEHKRFSLATDVKVCPRRSRGSYAVSLHPYPAPAPL